MHSHGQCMLYRWLPPDHPTHPGLFKGMAVILEECNIHAECVGFKCPKDPNGEYGCAVANTFYSMNLTLSMCHLFCLPFVLKQCPSHLPPQIFSQTQSHSAMLGICKVDLL